MVVVVATKFSVKHQGKDIHHPPSTIYKWPLRDLPRSTLCPSLSLSFTIKFNHILRLSLKFTLNLNLISFLVFKPAGWLKEPNLHIHLSSWFVKRWHSEHLPSFNGSQRRLLNKITRIVDDLVCDIYVVVHKSAKLCYHAVCYKRYQFLLAKLRTSNC